MQLADRNRDLDLKMSPSIYAALIDSLFQNPAPMFAGAVFAAVAAVMTALKTGDNWLWPCAALLIVTGAVRAVDMHRYKSRNCALNAEDAAGWEIRYQIGAMFYAAALGIWCLVALITSNDPVAHMICLTVTTGYMAAGVGRTYGRPWIFHLQIVLACGPMTIGLGLHGDPYYIGMACLSALFFLALKQITTGLQRMFVRALVAHEREAALANQFDTALNNMPHGLCMFGADGRRRHRGAAGRHHRAAQRGSADQPSRALRRADGAAQPAQFPRRDRASAGAAARCDADVGVAVHRPRPVQAGQ
jgi:hypothetical protein